jgi:hypothetical protein
MASMTAAAEPSLAGRWDSDSLRDNGIGYFAQLRPAPGGGYIGFLRFAYRDGRLEPKMRITARQLGNVVTLTAREGTFDRSGTMLRGVIDRRTGALTLTNCADRLRQVMSWDLDSDCVLRPRG